MGYLVNELLQARKLLKVPLNSFPLSGPTCDFTQTHLVLHNRISLIQQTQKLNPF